MARLAHPYARQRPRSRVSGKRSRHGVWIALGGLTLVTLAMAGAVFAFSNATLHGDRAALARIALQPFAGSIASVRASGPTGQRIPLTVEGDRLTPRRRLSPGELVAVSVVIRRPRWSSWALGRERRETLSIRTPTAHVLQRWLTVRTARELGRETLPPPTSRRRAKTMVQPFPSRPMLTRIQTLKKRRLWMWT